MTTLELTEAAVKIKLLWMERKVMVPLKVLKKKQTHL